MNQLIIKQPQGDVTYSTLNLFNGVSGVYEILIIIFGTIGSVIISFSYLPQLIKTIKTKGTTGLSFYMWLLVVIGEMGFVIWGILYVVQGCLANTFEKLYSLGYITMSSGSEPVVPTDVNNEQVKNFVNEAHTIAVNAGLINGLALFVCDVPALIIAFMLLVLKTRNIINARKNKMSEAQWCDQLYNQVQAKKNVKVPLKG